MPIYVTIILILISLILAIVGSAKNILYYIGIAIALLDIALIINLPTITK
jgi:hypothetical protein